MSYFLPILGQPQSIPLTLKPAAVFPLDVYFLMDFSNSMKDDLATLQSIAVDIGEWDGGQVHNVCTMPAYVGACEFIMYGCTVLMHT